MASPSISEFLPKIVTVWREGYTLSALRADAIAGLTVAIVALPLSMAIAIASGVGPEAGLFTTIVGGFLVSLLGGSRYQIGGPAGAFIVLVAACVATIGPQGLILATIMSGLFMTAAGLFRLGSYIRYIPYPVTLGFTAGIAVIIATSQVKDLFGLHLAAGEPAAFIPKVEALWAARATFSMSAALVSIGTIAVIQILKRVAPRVPNLLIAVTLGAVIVAVFNLPVETIHDRFGDLPRIPPAPSLPELNWASLSAALPYALSFTLLGSIEIPALRRRRRRDERRAPPLQRGAGGPRHRKRRRRPVWRVLHHRHHRPHRHQRPRRVTRAHVGDAARPVRPVVHADRRPPRWPHPTGLTGRVAGRGSVEHGREG